MLIIGEKVIRYRIYYVLNIRNNCVNIIFHRPDWASAKMVLGDVNFLKTLQNYDTDNISDKMINQITPYIENPDFNPKIVATQSKVAKSMCMWVRAVHSYSLVYRIVEPKIRK
jgi:dynein heavy chain